MGIQKEADRASHTGATVELGENERCALRSKKTNVFSPDRHLRAMYVAVWFAVLLIAAFLRFASLSEQSLWSDEIQTIEIARGSLAEVALTAARTDISASAFFLVGPRNGCFWI